MPRSTLAGIVHSLVACLVVAAPVNGMQTASSAIASSLKASISQRGKLKAVAHLSTSSASKIIFDLQALSHIAWSSDDTIIAAYSSFVSDISVWSSKSGSLVSHSTRVNILSPEVPIAFSNDKQVLIAAAPSENRLLPAVSLLRIASGNVIQDVPGPFPKAGWRENIAQLAAFSTATQTLVAAFGFPGQETLIAYRLDKNDRLAAIATIGVSDHFSTKLAFSPNGQLLAVGTAVGTVTIYETTSWTIVDKANFFPETLTSSGEGKNTISSLAFSPAGTAIAAGAGGVNLSRHRPSSLVDGQRDPALAEEPFISNALRSPIRIYDLEQHHFRSTAINIRQPVDQLSWAREDILLFTADDGGLTQCILTDGPAEVVRLLEPRVTSFSLSTSRHQVAVSENDQTTIYAIDDH